MGIADYCGIGDPHTVPGTWIAKFNNHTVTPQVQPLASSTLQPGDALLQPDYYSPSMHKQHFFFEAAWRSGLKFSPSPQSKTPQYTDGPGGAYCLTKKRWSTIPYLPMADQNKCPNLTPEFCRDTEKSMEELDPKNLLFTYSLFLDVGLYSCQNSVVPALWRTSTTEQLDDIGNGAVTDTNATTDPKQPVFKHDETSPPSQFVCLQGAFEGTVLRWDANGAPLPEGFPVNWGGSGSVPVALYLHNLGSGKYVTDTNKNTMAVGEQGSPAPTPIGYILPTDVCSASNASSFCGNPLKLYTTSNQYLTTASMSPLPDPFTGPGTVLGYLIKVSK